MFMESGELIDRFEWYSWMCMKTSSVSLFILVDYSADLKEIANQTEFAEPTLKIIPGSELWKWHLKPVNKMNDFSISGPSISISKDLTEKLLIFTTRHVTLFCGMRA